MNGVVQTYVHHRDHIADWLSNKSCDLSGNNGVLYFLIGQNYQGLSCGGLNTTSMNSDL